MDEDIPLTVGLPAAELKSAQRRVLWFKAADDRFGAVGIASLANRKAGFPPRADVHSESNEGPVWGKPRRQTALARTTVLWR
jgi:hypothetical protein